MTLNIQNLSVTSPDFSTGERLDDRFSADGGNEPPTIAIDGAPPEAIELALICHDPDAPLPHGFTHWTVYGVPPTTPTLPDADVASREGPNTAGATGYHGPQPPAGHGDHHYYFWVYALDTQVEGEPTREQFLERYAGHIIEQNRVVGVYSS